MDILFLVGGISFCAGFLIGVVASTFVVLAAETDKPVGYSPDSPFDSRWRK